METVSTGFITLGFKSGLCCLAAVWPFQREPVQTSVLVYLQWGKKAYITGLLLGLKEETDAKVLSMWPGTGEVLRKW